MANKPFPFSVCKECCSTGGDVPAGDYYTKEEIDSKIGDIDAALDELHNYAQGLINGGAE